MGARAFAGRTWTPAAVHRTGTTYEMSRALLAALLLTPTALSEPPPWHPASRFRALRFECAPTAASARVLAVAVRDAADAADAFGWVQVAAGGRVVGEFRGAAAAAPDFEAALHAAAGAAGARAPCATRVYADALIALHFADFKILTDDRETCFPDAPHACAAAAAAAAAEAAGAAVTPDGAVTDTPA
jgi:hypothetical protein